MGKYTVKDHICPKCGTLMETRYHSKLKQQDLKKSYIFSQWDACLNCHHLQHYEKYKIINETDDFNNLKAKEQLKLTLTLFN